MSNTNGWDMKSMEEKLKKFRGHMAHKGGTEPYKIFTNEIMNTIMEMKPTDLVSLRNVKGMGPKRVEAYGEEIIKIVESCSPRVKSSSSFS